MVTMSSPNQSSRGSHTPTLIVIHGDAGKSDAGTVSWIMSEQARVSYHYLVGRDGEVYRFVDEAEKAWHAGKSTFHGEEVAGSVNPISVGVAFANDGQEPYRDVQYVEGGKLVAGICKRWQIPIHRTRGHFEVSPGRKTDPWDHFDWLAFYRRTLEAA